MNKQPTILLFATLALLATAPFSSAQAQQPTEEQVTRILKRFPEADKDKDGKLSTEPSLPLSPSHLCRNKSKE